MKEDVKVDGVTAKTTLLELAAQHLMRELTSADFSMLLTPLLSKYKFDFLNKKFLLTTSITLSNEVEFNIDEDIIGVSGFSFGLPVVFYLDNPNISSHQGFVDQNTSILEAETLSFELENGIFTIALDSASGRTGAYLIPQNRSDQIKKMRLRVIEAK